MYQRLEKNIKQIVRLNQKNVKAFQDQELKNSAKVIKMILQVGIELKTIQAVVSNLQNEKKLYDIETSKRIERTEKRIKDFQVLFDSSQKEIFKLQDKLSEDIQKTKLDMQSIDDKIKNILY